MLEGMKTFKYQKGFTLIELMIVIAIIAIIAAVAIPNLLRARQSANEASAISSLRTLVSAQAMFYQDDREGDGAYDYADSLTELEHADMIDNVLGTGRKSGYCFILFSHVSSTWHAHAEPALPGETGSRAFYIDETGILRFTTSSRLSADQRSQPIDGISEPSPSTDHRTGEAPACDRRATGLPSMEEVTSHALQTIHRVGLFVEREVVDKALGMSKRKDIQRAVLVAIDKDKDGSLTFQEVLSANILGVARELKGILQNDQPKDKMIGRDKHLLKPLEWFSRTVANVLNLGVANETKLPSVPIDVMLKDPLPNK